MQSASLYFPTRMSSDVRRESWPLSFRESDWSGTHFLSALEKHSYLLHIDEFANRVQSRSRCSTIICFRKDLKHTANGFRTLGRGHDRHATLLYTFVKAYLAVSSSRDACSHNRTQGVSYSSHRHHYNANLQLCGEDIIGKKMLCWCVTVMEEGEKAEMM